MPECPGAGLCGEIGLRLFGFEQPGDVQLAVHAAGQRDTAAEPLAGGHCINDFYPAEWVLGESKESVFYQIVGLTDSLVSGKTSDFEKARAIYDWVSQNIAYDYVAYEYRVSGAAIYDEDEEKDMRADQAVDAFYTFYNRRGVCDGYANLTWLMLTIAEVPGAFISGTDHQRGMLHGWNAAYAGGRWILFDATWSKWDIDGRLYDWCYSSAFNVI